MFSNDFTKFEAFFKIIFKKEVSLEFKGSSHCPVYSASQGLFLSTSTAILILKMTVYYKYIHTYLHMYIQKKSLNGNFNFIHSSRVQFMLFWFSVVVCASSEFSILKFLSSILHSHWLRICMQYHNHLYASNLKVSDDVELLCNR